MAEPMRLEAAIPSGLAFAAPDLKLTVEDDLHLARVTAHSARERDAIARVFALPDAGRQTTGPDGLACAWLGPNEWLLAGSRDAIDATKGKLDAALAGEAALVVDITHACVPLRLRGAAARERISSGCPLDLRDSAFPPGRVARSVFGDSAIFLARLDEGAEAAWRIVVDQTMARYVAALLRPAGVD